MSNTGQAWAPRSTVIRLSTDRVSVSPEKLAVAMEFPATSCAQVTVAAGCTIRSNDSRRNSRVSRGRSIRRCGPVATAVA